MARLSDFDKERVRYHLRYNLATTPAGYYAQLEEAMNEVDGSFWHSKIIAQLQRCEDAEAQTEVFGAPVTTRELIQGDVNRSVLRSDTRKALQEWDQIYLYETDRLAEILQVPNFKSPEVKRFAIERSGAEYIMSIPGPADTAIGSRLLLYANWR